MFFYHIISSANWKLSSFEIKKGGDAKSNKERSVFSPGAGRLPENGGNYLPRMFSQIITIIDWTFRGFTVLN